MKRNLSNWLLGGIALLAASEAWAQSAPKAVKTRLGECEYQVLAGLAEVVRVEKVTDKEASPLQYDEYAIFFKFIPKEGGELMSTLRDQEIEFFLRGGGEQIRVGPQYIKQYQIRQGTKYAMKFLQSPLCEEKYRFGDQGGLPNDLFEAEKNLGELKKRRLEEALQKREGALEDDQAAKDAAALGKETNPRKLDDETRRKLEEEQRIKQEEEAKAKAEAARIKRETEFRRMEEKLARANDPANNPQPAEDPVITEPVVPKITTVTITEPSTVTEPSIDSVAIDSAAKASINEEELRRQLTEEISRKLAEERLKKEREEEERKRKEEELRKKQEAKDAKAKAKEEERQRKEAERLKKEEAERNKRQQEIEEQARKAQEARLKKELEDKIRAEILEKETERIKQEEEDRKRKAEEERIAAEEKRIAAEKEAAMKKRIEDELRRADCKFQPKVAGVIQVIAIRKLEDADPSYLGYTEYEVKVKFIPSNIDDLPKKDRKVWESEHIFVLDPQGKSANPSAGYIRKFNVTNNARFNGFAQMLETGNCSQIIMYSPQLPVDANQLNVK